MDQKKPAAVRIDRAENPPRWILTVMDGDGPAPIELPIPGRRSDLLLEVLSPGERRILTDWWRVTAWIEPETLWRVIGAGDLSAAG